jgi:hypothetical protein
VGFAKKQRVPLAHSFGFFWQWPWRCLILDYFTGKTSEMMRIQAKKVNLPVETHTCVSCGHVFKGKVCNLCGEKVFRPKQLSTGHFFHQVIDFFLHFENKVLRTLWLNLYRPGFVTQENLRGARVRYANPVQLYLVVSVFFFLAVSKLNIRDYIPSKEDHHYFYLSDYAIFKWAKPLDEKVVATIDTLQEHRFGAALAAQQEKILDKMAQQRANAGPGADSFTVARVPELAAMAASASMNAKFNGKIGTYGKLFTFLVLPLFALVFFALFYKKLKYYGAGLILATHFMVYNLCFYVGYNLLTYLPYKLFGGNSGGWLFWPIDLLFNNPVVKPVTEMLVAGDFELLHLVFWMPWLMLAFKRLFGLRWWLGLPVAYLCARIFYYLIFGVLKKALIAYTVWSL